MGHHTSSSLPSTRAMTNALNQPHIQVCVSITTALFRLQLSTAQLCVLCYVACFFFLHFHFESIVFHLNCTVLYCTIYTIHSVHLPTHHTHSLTHLLAHPPHPLTLEPARYSTTVPPLLIYQTLIIITPTTNTTISVLNVPRW